MKNKLSFQAAVWWLVLCAVVGLLLLAGGDKDPRESEEENRMLAGFPKASLSSLADASFMSGVEDYLSDGFVGRTQIKHFVSRLTGAFNALSSDDRMDKAIVDMEKKLAAEGAANEGEAVPAESETEEEESAEVYEGQVPVNAKKSYVWLKRVDGGNKLLYSYSLDNINTYAGTLRTMLNYLTPDGQIYFTQVPLASMAYRWTTQREVYCGWGSNVEDMLRGSVGDSRIHVFNTPEILEKPLAEGKYLFYRTDHHWTAEGAYLVAKEMLASQGLPVAGYDEFNYKVVQSAANDAGEQDTFDVLYPLLPTRSQVITQKTKVDEISLMNYQSITYRSFMNGTRLPWRRVITGTNTGRKAVVLCDSFGNAFVPYLLPYYDEVHMVDFRYGYFDRAKAGGSIGELMKYFGINDAYIVVSTSNDLRKDNSLVYLKKYLV